MAHDTAYSGSWFFGNRSALLALLLAPMLGALACGDGGSTGASPTDTEGASMDTNGPGGVDDDEPVESPGANGNGEGTGANPTMLDGQIAPSTGESPSPDPNASLVRGADPTRQSASVPGPFQVLVVTSGLRDGPEYGSQTLYVPEDAEPPFAAVAIVPGYNTPESSIQAWGPFLASHGIVALTIGTNSPDDSADARARAVLDALETLEAENTRAGGPLESRIAVDHFAIMGWSLGGGGVLTAASSTPSLKAAITMAAFGPGAEFPENQVPTLFLAGSNDAGAGGHSQGMFASLPDTTPKMLFEVEDGPHEIGNDPENADGEIGRYGLSWLEVFLVGDERYRSFLEETPTDASDFRQNLGAP